MTRPSERELEREIKDIGIGASQSQFVRQVAAVLDGDRDAVSVSPPDGTGDVELVLQVTDAADVSPPQAWEAVDAAGADPELIADFTGAKK